MSTAVPISDERLQQLAAEPAEDLFPISISGTAFAPWIVVLAFLPPLAGIMKWSLDERTAVWGLRALDVAAGSESEIPLLQGAPPLSSWLSAGLISLVGTPLPLGLTGISYLSAAITVICAARLARRLGVPRLAGLTALCCAGSPLLLNSAHAGGPEALGLCLMTVSLERFFAHLDSGIRRWSGRLLASGLAWGGCWLALGWPALCLGAALAIHVFLFRGERADRPTGENSRLGLPSMQNYRRSLVLWCVVGLLSGTWWMWDAVRQHGLAATFAWLFDATPNAISPLAPYAWEIDRWGATVGLTFLLGWIVLGLQALIRNSGNVLAPVGDGRRIVILLWWIGLLVCRTVVAASGADPTLWDVLQTVPACLTAAIGMELVMQRSLKTLWLTCGIGCGLLSLAFHVALVDSPRLDVAVGLGAVVLLLPLLINLVQTRSFHWGEVRIRWALLGLLVSTWLAHMTWGVTQSVPASSAEVKFATQLSRLNESLPSPGAVIVVSQTAPPKSLAFLVRRQWPQCPVVAAERWETALSQTLSVVDDWADSEFLVVELTRRESQFRRPGAGWIVSTVGEPRRYYGDQLTLHRVSVHSP